MTTENRITLSWWIWPTVSVQLSIVTMCSLGIWNTFPSLFITLYLHRYFLLQPLAFIYLNLSIIYESQSLQTFSLTRERTGKWCKPFINWDLIYEYCRSRQPQLSRAVSSDWCYRTTRMSWSESLTTRSHKRPRRECHFWRDTRASVSILLRWKIRIESWSCCHMLYSNIIWRFLLHSGPGERFEI